MQNHKGAEGTSIVIISEIVIVCAVGTVGGKRKIKLFSSKMLKNTVYDRFPVY